MQFSYTAYACEVLFGAGSLDRLAEAAGRYGWRRVLVCTVSSLRGNGQVARIEAALGDRLAGTFEPVRQHVPDYQVAEAVQLAVEREADAILGFGGGSPIGLAKATSAALAERRAKHAARAASPAEQPLTPVIGIPTTYAGSEMTPVYGVTHHDSNPPRKVTVNDPKIAPRLVLYDPDLTLDLPPAVTAASGINALAHCVEAVYSVRRNPVSSAAALGGVRHIARALPRCWAQGDDREARAEMALGAHLAAVALSSVSMALHHGLCHVLGGSAGVPHGIANAIVLPHAMRFNLQTTAPTLAQVAEAIGVDASRLGDLEAAAAATERVSQLIGQLGLPQRLRDAAVPEDRLPGLAQLALRSSAVQSNPRPVRDAAEIEALLREMW